MRTEDFAVSGPTAIDDLRLIEDGGEARKKIIEDGGEARKKPHRTSRGAGSKNLGEATHDL